MRFLHPAGFWLALAMAGLLLAYLVRRRARRVEVPFLPLWAAALAQQHAGLGSRLVRHLDLLLLLLACGAIAGAAGGPFLPGRPDTTRDLVLLLDGGVELRAKGRIEALYAAAREEVARRAPGTEIVVIALRDEGERVSAARTPAEAFAAVDAHAAGWTKLDPGAGFDLGRLAARRMRDPDLVFCTFRASRPEGFRVRAFGGAAPNAGFVALEVLSDPESGGRIARATLRGAGRVRVDEIFDGELRGERLLDLPLRRGGRTEVGVRMEGDAFPYDDVLRFELPEAQAPRVLVVAEGEPSPFLAAAMAALEAVGAIRGPLDRTTPERIREAMQDYDLLLFDRCAPLEELPGLRAIYLAPPGGALPFALGEEAGAPVVFDARVGHPLLAGVDLARSPPLRARALRGGEPLAYAAPGPILAASESWVALGFDPDRSILGASPAYPLFLRNAIAHLAATARDTAPEFFTVGERAPARGDAFVEGFGPLALGESVVGPPGFWLAGDRAFAVNLVEPDLDLAGPGSADPLPPVGDPGQPDRRLESWFALTAIALLLAAWLWT
ncbi:MAG: BatA domain-containing protein [Planctomycetaceae bacterium]